MRSSVLELAPLFASPTEDNVMEQHPPGTNAQAACTLQGESFDDRAAAWRQLAARAIRREAEPGRVRSVYPHEAQLIERLAGLIEAERACCPFLRFTVREEGDVVHVELEYPPDFEAVLGSVFAPT